MDQKRSLRRTPDRLGHYLFTEDAMIFDTPLLVSPAAKSWPRAFIAVARIRSICAYASLDGLDGCVKRSRRSCSGVVIVYDGKLAQNYLHSSSVELEYLPRCPNLDQLTDASNPPPHAN